jgi:hypothetical protein
MFKHMALVKTAVHLWVPENEGKCLYQHSMSGFKLVCITETIPSM